MKARGVEAATLALLRAPGCWGAASSPPSTRRWWRPWARCAPEALRFLLTDAWDDEAYAAVLASGATGVCLRVDAATALSLEVLRNEDLPVVVWTVNEPGRLRRPLRAGVAG